MSDNRMVFNISFRSLLIDVCDSLGWKSPIYNRIDGEFYQASVVLTNTQTLLHSEFKGTAAHTLVESEDDAARHAILCLIEKGLLLVNDVNYDHISNFQKCELFFRAKIKQMNFSVAGNSSTTTKCFEYELTNQAPTKVSISFHNLLIDILNGLRIVTTPRELHFTEDEQFACTMGLISSESAFISNWFISDSSGSWESAEESPAQKVIVGLQAIHRFVVRDVDYYRLGLVAVHCGLQYKTHKERATTLVLDIDDEPPITSLGYNTPTASGSMILPKVEPPPPPKKKRATAVNWPLQHAFPTNFVNVPDDFFTFGHVFPKKDLAVKTKTKICSSEDA